jgi:hypothetical protein
MRITYHSWLQNLFITLICVIVGGASVEGPNLSVPNATKVSVVRLMKYILVGDVTEQVYESFALIKLRHQSFSIGPNSRFRQLGVLMDDVERMWNIRWQTSEARRGVRCGTILALDVLGDVLFMHRKEQGKIRSDIKSESLPEIDHRSLGGDGITGIIWNLKSHRLYSYPSPLILPELFCRDRDLAFSVSGGPYRSVGGSTGGASLPPSQTSIDKEQTSRYFGPKKYFITVGSVVTLVGLILLFKVIDKINLDPRFNVDVAVCGFFLALAMFLLGGWIVFRLLGLVT